jgi:hypothetical protein
VENYNKQMNAYLGNLDDNDEGTNAPPGTPQESGKKKRKPKMPAWQRISQEVGETRLERMRKLYEGKVTMPEKESEYYDSVSRLFPFFSFV